MKQYQPKTFLRTSSKYHYFVPVNGGQACISGNHSFFCCQFFFLKIRARQKCCPIAQASGMIRRASVFRSPVAHFFYDKLQK